jgi:mercuric reductase
MATIVQGKYEGERVAGNKDLLQVLNHLQQLLPLSKRQAALAPYLRIVHRAIVRSLGETGKPPTQAEIAAMLGSRQSALHALAVLGSNDLVILNGPVTRDEKSGRRVVSEKAEVVGAYPMTTENTPHRVVLSGHSVNAMCAVDALSISPLFGRETWIESRCHVTGTTIRILQHGTQILEASPSPEIRVGIRWQSLNNTCAAHTLCTEMVFLRDEETAHRWRNTDPASIELLTLPEAIELGVAFFLPLLEE